MMNLPATVNSFVMADRIGSGKDLEDSSFNAHEHNGLGEAVQALSDSLLYTAARAGQYDEVLARFAVAFNAMDAALGVNREGGFSLTHEGEWTGGSGASSFSDEGIVLRGRMSVVTALHLYARTLGATTLEAQWFALNLFRLYWPNSYSRLIFPVGTYMVEAANAA